MHSRLYAFPNSVLVGGSCLFCVLTVCNKGTSLCTRETEGHKVSKFFLELTLKTDFQYFAEDCVLFIQLM